MTQKKLLIIGAAGFTGRHFIKYLDKNNITSQYELILVDVNKIDDNHTFYSADVTNREVLSALLNDIKPHIIVNLMGLMLGDDFSKFYSCNIEVPRTILEHAVYNSQVIKILLIGSAAEYGYVQENPVNEQYVRNPITPYGLSKVIQQDVANYYYRKFNVPVVIARTFNFWGEGISNKLAIGAWREKIANAKDGDTILFGNLESFRDFLTVEQVVDIYWKLICNAPAGEVYNVCSGKPIKMRTLLDEVIAESGKKIIVQVDKSLYKKDDLPIIYGDNTKLKLLLQNT